MPPCSERVNGHPCVAAAGPSGRCSVHAAGYAQAAYGSEMRCGKCRRVIQAGEWTRRSGEHIQHAKDCREHPDVTAERAKATA